MAAPATSTSRDLLEELRTRAAIIASMPSDDLCAVLDSVGADDADTLHRALGGLDGLLFPVLRRRRGLTPDLVLDPDVWRAAIDHEAPLVIPRDTIESWAGDMLAPETFQRLAAAVPHSSVPEAIATITAAITDDP